MLLAFSRRELEHQLKQMNNPDLDIAENLNCLDKMNPKEQKVALFWLRKKSVSFPEDKDKFNEAMKLINKQRLDYQKFDNPDSVLSRKDKSTIRIKNQDTSFNPDNEPTFTDKKTLKNGVVVYLVENSGKGQEAVRKAVDVNWGYDSNPWCLIARDSAINQDDVENMTEEEKEEMGLYGDELESAWFHWKHYNAIPKRIAFQNGKLLAFSASDENEVEWWDRNNEPTENIPGLEVKDDDIEFLKKYCQMTLLRMPDVSHEMLDELSNNENRYVKMMIARHPKTSVETLERLSNDEYYGVREYVGRNPNTPVKILERLADDEDYKVREGVEENPKVPVRLLEKLAGDEISWIRNLVASNPNTTAEILNKLADDEDDDVRKTVVNNAKTSIETLKKLSNDKDDAIKLRAKSILFQRKRS